ncbi:MAG TPA: hypothetical protein PKO06_08930 [Candidatus Ozemobacteraceae bacterium]|nr:hypothetical protein [Candidatus Ozemobacteraceae bacterium]
MSRLIVILTLCLFPSILMAQYTNYSTGNTFNNPGSALIDTFIQSKMNQQMMLKSMNKKGKNTPETVKNTPHSTNFDYSSSTFKGMEKRLLPDIIASAVADVSAADRLLLSSRLAEAIENYEVQSGRKNNVSHAISFLLGVSLQITRHIEVSDADLEELAQAVHGKIQADADWKNLGDEQKQLLYEETLIQASLLLALQEKGDAASRQSAQDQAKQCLNRYGITE